MDNVREKQIGALGLCAFSAPAILFLPQADWRWTTVVVGMAMLIMIFGKPVDTGNSAKKMRFVGIPLFIWNIIIMSKTAWDISGIHGVSSPLPGLLLLLLAAYGVKKEVLPVVGAVLVFFIVGIYGILYLFALPDTELTKTVWQTQGGLNGISFGFLPILLLYMYKGERRKEREIWALIGLLLVLGAMLITKGMGASTFYTASMSVNVLGAMERLEPFVGVALTVGGFCLMGMLLSVNQSLWEKMKMEKRKYPIVLLTIVAGIGIWLVRKVDARIIEIGTTVCWGFVPILTQLVVTGKKE